jgi:putative transcriptional regulator
MMDFLQGHFLVASPQLDDPNFLRTVILLAQHDSNGALGVVLNRSTTKSMVDIWDVLGEGPCPSCEPLHVGGPVAGPLIVVHTDENSSDLEIVPGLFLTTSRDSVVRVVNREDVPFRLFSGYSGWGEGQLEREIQTGSWLITAATLDDVFSDPEELWTRLCRRIGKEGLSHALPLDRIPDDPSAN